MRRSTSTMIIEPPHPPQKQIRPSRQVRQRVGLGQAVADAEAQRHAEHEVDAVRPAPRRSGRSSPGESSRTPSTAPPLATTDWMRATDRALP